MKAFISYSHIDERYVKRLHTHLSQLKRDGHINTWYDREISAGGILNEEIRQNLDSSDIFIAITSPDFLGSSYCYDKEMTWAIERHELNNMRIVPIIVEPCDWLNSPLSKFRATPTDGKPISSWSNQNNAFLEVINDLRAITKPSTKIKEVKHHSPTPNKGQRPEAVSKMSNLRVKKDFDKIEKVEFKKTAYSEIAETLKQWCTEANDVEGLRAKFEMNGENRFFVTLVNKAKSNATSERTVYTSEGSSFGSGINILNSRSDSSTSSNGSYSVNADDYHLFLSSLFSMLGNREKKMTPLDAANEIWNAMMRDVGIDYAD